MDGGILMKNAFGRICARQMLAFLMVLCCFVSGIASAETTADEQYWLIRYVYPGDDYQPMTAFQPIALKNIDCLSGTDLSLRLAEYGGVSVEILPNLSSILIDDYTVIDMDVSGERIVMLCEDEADQRVLRVAEWNEETLSYDKTDTAALLPESYMDGYHASDEIFLTVVYADEADGIVNEYEEFVSTFVKSEDGWLLEGFTDASSYYADWIDGEYIFNDYEEPVDGGIWSIPETIYLEGLNADKLLEILHLYRNR